MAEVQAFQDEVSRIINASYQVSLLNLHELTQKFDPRTLQQWAESKPCQVDRLASALIQGLQQWPHTLAVLEHLAAVPVFRDSILHQSPLLIDTLLKHAQQSPLALDEHSRTCIAMLSSKFSNDTPVPASLESFFVDIIGANVESPSATTTRAVYNLVHSIGPCVFNGVGHDLLEKFVDVCILLVGKGSDETQSAALSRGILCLATLATVMCSRRHSVAKPGSGSMPLSSSENRSSSEDWLRKVSDLFSPDRTPTTLNLVVAHLIAVFSAHTDLSPAETLLHIKASGEILQGLDSLKVKTYLERKTKAALIEKLRSKVQKSMLGPEYQIPAMLFVVSMYRFAQLPTAGAIGDLTNLIEKCVKEGHLGLLLPSEWSEVVKSIGPSFGQPLTTRVLRIAMLTAEVGPVSSRELLNLASSAAIIEQLENSIQSSIDIQDCVKHFISSEQFSGLWVRFANDAARPDWGNWELHGVCSHSAELRRRRIIAICSLVLKASSSAGVSVLAIPTALSPIELLKHKSLCLSQATCDYAQSSKLSARISIAEIESTPMNPSSSHDWQARLDKDLDRQAQQSRGYIIRSVGEICRDLEQRCISVEQPLRDMTINFERAEAEREAMRNLVHETEKKVVDKQSTITTLESDNADLRNEVNALHTRLDSQGKDLESLRDDIMVARDGANLASKNAAEKINLKELEVQAKAVAKDEKIDAQKHDLSLLRAQVTDLVNQKEQTIIEKDKALMKARSLEQQMHTAETNVNDLRTTLELSIEQVSNIESEKRSLAALIEDINKKLAHALAQHEVLLSEVHDIKEAHARELQSQDESHAHMLLEVGQEAAERLSSRDDKIKELHSALTSSEARAAADVQIKDHTISELRTKVMKLKKQHAKLAHAQEYLQNILGPDSSTETPQLRVRRNKELLEGAEQQGPLSLAAMPMSIPSMGLDGARDARSICSSSSNSGPTPKRLKPHRYHRSPAFERTVQFIPVAGDGMNHKTPRRALEEVPGGNRSTGQTPKGEIWLGGRMLGPSTLSGLGLGNLENESFSDGDIFTSSSSREERGKNRDKYNFVTPDTGMEIEDETTDEL